MTREELRREYIRVERGEGPIRIQVGVVTWSDPGTPGLEWEQAARKRRSTDESELERITEALLDDPRYFRICSSCNTHLPEGLTGRSPGSLSETLDDTRYCHGCLNRMFGTVF